MTNPIIQALKQAAPGVDIPKSVHREAARSEEPQAVADRIAENITELHALMKKALGLSDVPIEWVLKRLILRNKVTTYASMPWAWYLQIFKKAEVWEIAQASQKEAAAPPIALMHQIDAVYRSVFGADRGVDLEGGLFWAGHIASGTVLLDDLEGFLKRSPEYASLQRQS